MDTCNIHEMRVHLDSVYVEGEETTCLMRELEKHGREGKDLVGWGIDNFVRGREGLVILCKRERVGGRSQSAVVTSPCFHMTPHSLARCGRRLRSARCPLWRLRCCACWGAKKHKREWSPYNLGWGWIVCSWECVCVSCAMCVCVRYWAKTNLRREMGIHEEIVWALRWAGAGWGCQNVRVDACVACDRARDGRIERDGCCVTDAPLSLSLTHTHTQVN